MVFDEKEADVFKRLTDLPTQTDQRAGLSGQKRPEVQYRDNIFSAHRVGFFHKDAVRVYLAHIFPSPDIAPSIHNHCAGKQENGLVLV